ncbi:hypothetical protein [Pasteurella sp. PK-2025]|uniref:hypothetical protein n=1 Tax=Pasteurella sp. PK-2025 TaxID=3413133 RepID=UPI003C74BF6A
MKLFQLAKQSHDGKYKFYTVENVVQFMDQKYQGKIPDIVIKLNIFEEKSKRIDFNISTSLPYFLLMMKLRMRWKHLI